MLMGSSRITRGEISLLPSFYVPAEDLLCDGNMPSSGIFSKCSEGLHPVIIIEPVTGMGLKALAVKFGTPPAYRSQEYLPLTDGGRYGVGALPHPLISHHEELYVHLTSSHRVVSTKDIVGFGVYFGQGPSLFLDSYYHLIREWFIRNVPVEEEMDSLMSRLDINMSTTNSSPDCSSSQRSPSKSHSGASKLYNRSIPLSDETIEDCNRRLREVSIDDV